MFGRKKKRIVPGKYGPSNREESLAFVPVRNREVREEIHDGVVRLIYLVAPKPWFGTLAQRFGKWDGRPMEKKLELDEMGALAWSRINGENSVRDIARIFVDTYGLQTREAEMSVTAFIKELGRRGIVGLR